MASLSKIQDGQLTELKRILGEAGFDTIMAKGFRRKPELAKPWVDYGRELLAGRLPCGDSNKATVPTKPRLFKRNDGSYGFKSIRNGLTDEQIVADFQAGGWTFNSYIRTDYRWNNVPGKPRIAVGTTQSATIKRDVVPSSESWKLQKVTDAIGAPALAFDLEDLRNLVLGREDELLNRGIRWVVAPAARFRHDDDDECVVYANLKNRKLGLNWVGRAWGGEVWFGSCK
jgi:hypothetical protein